jgi:hypothetical protein
MIYFFNLHQKCDDELISNSTEENTGLLGEGKTMNQCGEPMCSPSKEVLEAILNFSRSYEAVKTESSGYVEMNLN